MNGIRSLCAVVFVSMLCPASMQCTLEPQAENAPTQPEQRKAQQTAIAAVIQTNHMAGTPLEKANTHPNSIAPQGSISPKRPALSIVIPSDDNDLPGKNLPEPPDSPQNDNGLAGKAVAGPPDGDDS